MVLISSCQAPVERYFPHSRCNKAGDNRQWAEPEFDDSLWDHRGDSLSIGLQWQRYRIQLDSSSNQLLPLGIRVISWGAYEAFWDGQPIGGSGRVGADLDEEVPGDFYSQLLIPETFSAPGEHVLALRVSNHYLRRYLSWNAIYVSAGAEIGKTGLRVTAFMFILGGIFLSAGFYYLSLFLRAPDRPQLIFGLMCLLFFSLLVLEYWKFLSPYPYPFQQTRLSLIGFNTLLLAGLTPAFFLDYFALPRRYLLWIVVLLGLVGIALYEPLYFDSTSHRLGVFSWLSTLLVIVYAWWQKRPESHIVLAIFLLFYALPQLLNSWPIAGLYLYPYDITLFLSFALLVLTQLYLLSQRTQAQRLAYEASLVRSERLQLELLRKQIQPHYLMNTLTILMEEVEQNPKRSVEFIEALAAEFSAFHVIAQEKTISLKREIELCQSHLKVMLFRSTINYEWLNGPLLLERTIPAGVMLTLVENGITHSRPQADGTIRFELHEDQPSSPNKRVYRLDVFAQNRKTPIGLQTGTGLSFIRSRLEENYGQDWQLKSGPTAFGWRNTLIIPQ